MVLGGPLAGDRAGFEALTPASTGGPLPAIANHVVETPEVRAPLAARVGLPTRVWARADESCFSETKPGFTEM